MVTASHPTATVGTTRLGNRSTVAIINDYEVVVRGVAAMLAPYERPDPGRGDGDGDDPVPPTDVALFDTFAGRRHTLSRAAGMVASGHVGHVVLYTWDAAPEFVRAAADIGVSGVVLKSRSAEVLVDGLARGERASGSGSTTSSPAASRRARSWSCRIASRRCWR